MDVAAQPVEGCVHGQVPALGEPLGRLDDHPIVQPVCYCSVSASPRRVARSDPGELAEASEVDGFCWVWDGRAAPAGTPLALTHL